MRSVLCAALVGLMSACASMNAPTSPSAEQIKAADYGEKPTAASFVAAINAWALDALKDPSSLQIRDVSTDSAKGWITECVEPGIPPYTDCSKRMFYFGHLVTAKLNAKNSAGGYTGYKAYTFLFRGEKIAGHTAEQ